MHLQPFKLFYLHALLNVEKTAFVSHPSVLDVEALYLLNPTKYI